MGSDEPILTDTDWELLEDVRAGTLLPDMLASRGVGERELRTVMLRVAEKVRIASAFYDREPSTGAGDESPTLRVPPMDPCPFCQNIAGTHPADRPPAVVFQDELTYLFLTRGPLGGMLGHALVCPRRHVETIFDVVDEEQAALGRAVARAARVLREALDPPGLLIQQNNGAAAFQTVPHVHFHVIPKTHGPFPPLEMPPAVVDSELIELASNLGRRWATQPLL